MILQQFDTLCKHDQLRTLLINAICIADRKWENNNVLLFQLDSSYTEVFFSNENEEILSSRKFDDLNELQPYLERMYLPSSHKQTLY